MVPTYFKTDCNKKRFLRDILLESRRNGSSKVVAEREFVQKNVVGKMAERCKAILEKLDKEML